MKPRMAVMKAKMRRLAELVLMGVRGMNISQVSFPNSAAKKKKKKLSQMLTEAMDQMAYSQTGERSGGSLDAGNAG